MRKHYSTYVKPMFAGIAYLIFLFLFFRMASCAFTVLGAQ